MVDQSREELSGLLNWSVLLSHSSDSVLVDWMADAVAAGDFFLILLFLVVILLGAVCNAVSAELGPTVLCLGCKLRG